MQWLKVRHSLISVIMSVIVMLIRLELLEIWVDTCNCLHPLYSNDGLLKSEICINYSDSVL